MPIGCSNCTSTFAEAVAIGGTCCGVQSSNALPSGVLCPTVKCIVERVSLETDVLGGALVLTVVR